MKYCKYCGQINDSDNNFCIRCGINIKNQIVTDTQENPNDSDPFYLENKQNKTKYILSIALYFFFFIFFRDLYNFYLQLFGLPSKTY